jgi:hypothetical protein
MKEHVARFRDESSAVHVTFVTPVLKVVVPIAGEHETEGTPLLSVAVGDPQLTVPVASRADVTPLMDAGQEMMGGVVS